MVIHPLEETENELTSKYDITQEQIEELKQNAAEKTRTMFEKKNLAANEEVIKLVHQRLLSNTLIGLNERDWPPDEDDLADSETPEEHFEVLCEEMREGGEDARNSLSFILGTLTSDVDKNHLIYKYAANRLGEKYR